jgi:ferredoxin-NADP reductase
VLMATVAVGLLVAVGVSSARAIRSRLRYETWHFIHLYTYIAVALTFSHQFADGADFVDNPRARWLWSALYIGVGATLIWFRFLVPVIGAFHHRLRVLAVQAESPETTSIYISGRFLDELGAESGQFFRWRFLTRDLWWAANPYSLSAPPRQDRMRITVKGTGGHSVALRQLRPGTRVLAEGPYGAFTAARRRRRKVLLIAGGVGITPLRSLFETLPGGPGEITLIYRARSEDELILARELDDIARMRGARVHYLMGGQSSRAATALAPQRLAQLVPDLVDHDVFICGPEAMMRATVHSLRQAGVSRRAIHYESFAF